jgi:hypothetical protein
MRNRIRTLLLSAFFLGVATPAQAFTCAGKQLGNYCNGNWLVTCAYGEIANEIYCSAGCLAQGSNSKCDEAGCDNFCCGKNLGNYCNGTWLVTCAYGEVANTINCPYGCEVGGTDVQCTDPPCDNFCCGKSLGNYCDGNTLVTCAYDEVANTIACPNGCLAQGGNSMCDSAGCTGFCCGKVLGNYCDGNTLVTCAYDEMSNALNCPEGCLAQGSNSKCHDTDCTGYCCGKPDGTWCHNNLLWVCSDGQSPSAAPCSDGCQEGAGPDAICNQPEAIDPDFCIGKAGYYCYEQTTVVYCKNHQISGLEECLGPCTDGPPEGWAVCPYETPYIFCQDHADGTWCNGADGITICQDGAAMGHVPCFAGCARTPPGEADFCAVPSYCDTPSVAPGPLGVIVDTDCCPHLTGTLVHDVPPMAQNTEGYQNIKLGTSQKSLWGSGCMVTAFSMFYEHEGFQRTLQGETLENSPANENAWRTHNVQGYTCCSDMDCDPGGIANKSCAIWQANPPGFGELLPVYNAPGGSCLLEVETAADIASVLNSGGVMLAFVKGQSTNQHWVLLVGVDANGTLLINDPWGGQQAAPIDGDQGPAPYHAMPMLLVQQGSGGGELLGDGGTLKSAALGDHEGPIGMTQFTDEGAAEFLAEKPPEEPMASDTDHDVADDLCAPPVDAGAPGAQTDGPGCGVGTSRPVPMVPLVLLTLLLAAVLRGRCAARDEDTP